jgi:hypothetical protein
VSDPDMIHELVDRSLHMSFERLERTGGLVLRSMKPKEEWAIAQWEELIDIDVLIHRLKKRSMISYWPLALSTRSLSIRLFSARIITAG